eukprot:Platyproteum_vivax@DN5683_c0_g1_i1.p1
MGKAVLQDTSGHPLRLMGMDISSVSRSGQFVMLACCHIMASTVFALCQEKASKTPGFKEHGGAAWMTLGTTLTFLICSVIELTFMPIENRMRKGESREEAKKRFVLAPTAPLGHYIVVSVLMYCGMYWTNLGLTYLTYPTRIVFKGAKPIPTMLLEFFYVRHVFSYSDIFGVVLLTLGITGFSYGDAVGAPQFHYLGVVLMMLGVCCDSLTSTYEKKNIFQKGGNHAEAMLYSSLFATAWSFLPMCYNPEWFDVLRYGVTNPMFRWILLSGLGGYFSIIFIMQIIAHFTATASECVKGSRKVISICLSYLLMGDNTKPFNIYHIIGLSLLLASIGLSVYTASTSKTKEKSTPPSSKKSSKKKD